MPLESDDQKITDNLAAYADRLEVAITKALNDAARLIPRDTAEWKNVETLRATLCILNGAGEGASAMVQKLKQKDVQALLGMLVVMAIVVGVNPGSVSTPDPEGCK